MRTVIWVMSLALVGLLFDGYDLVIYGACVSTFLRDATQLGVATPAIAGQLGSYALFGVLVGALLGSKVADRFVAKLVVAACFALGAFAILLLTAGYQVGVLLAVVALVGLGTSRTQTLIYGLVANFYRTNVRSAGVAWCAGFGRLGGVGGPMLGDYLAGGGFALERSSTSWRPSRCWAAP